MYGIRTCVSRFFNPSVQVNRKLFHTMVPNFDVIGTHDGTFHCDEVLGCFLLKLLNKDARIVRSRDAAVLDKCDIVIDVGGVYDPVKLRFDHHQKSFTHSMNTLRPEIPNNILLSSAGLIYCHFGEDILSQILGPVDGVTLPHIFKNVYESFVQEIDGIDNGVDMYDGEPRFNINTNLSKRVGFLNQRWNEEDFDEEAAFNKAMDLAGNEFVETVKYIHDVWWPAKQIVIEAVNQRYKVHESGEIVQFDTFVPFIEHIFAVEKELKIEPSIKYAIYKDNENWRIRAIPVAPSSFNLRVPLLEAWRGLREESIVNLGVSEGAIFVHVSGFIGGHRKREGVIEMAVKSLDAAR